MIPESVLEFFASIGKTVSECIEYIRQQFGQLLDTVLAQVVMWLCRYYERQAGC